MPESAVRTILSCCLLLATTLSNAKPVLTATCGEPVGTRYDQVNGEVVSKADGFTGVAPIFILDDENPKKLTFVWGPAAWARDELKLKANAQEAVVISITSDKITAVRVEGEGVTQMYSLYPGKGLVFFTQHRYIAPHMGGVPTTSSFYAKCAFSPRRAQ